MNLIKLLAERVREGKLNLEDLGQDLREQVKAYLESDKDARA